MLPFKIRQTTQLKEVMEEYCKQQSVAMSTVRFTYDGTRLGSESTPLEVRYYLNMQEICDCL